MAKHTKKATAMDVRPITHFFSRKLPPDNVPSSPQAPSQSENLKPRKPFAKSNSATPGAKPTASASAGRKVFDAVEIASSSKTWGNRHSTKQPKVLYNSDSDGEPPAPDAVYVLQSLTRAPSATSAHVPLLSPLRATENLTTAPQLRTRSKKKRRLSSTPGSEIVPTSQADEQDITLNYSERQALRPVETSGDDWLESALSPTLIRRDPLLGDIQDGFGSDMSPPRGDSLLTLSPSMYPQLLSPDTKTSQIIANIKTRAYADSLIERPETPIREFRDELSDNSDDDFALLPESPMRFNSSTVNQSHNPPGHYNLRNQSPASPSIKENRLIPGSSNCDYAISPNPSFHTKRQRKREQTNPIDDLLKEKKQHDLLGKGHKAFHQAETTLANRDVVMVGRDDDDLTNEDAARKTIVEYKQRGLQSSSPTSYETDDECKYEERERLLGEKHAKEVSRLFQNDNAIKEREKNTEKVIGVPLWSMCEDVENVMEVNEVLLPILHTPSPHLAALRSALECQDFAQATLLISSGLSSLDFADCSATISYFCELALSLNETTLCRSALHFLTQTWDTSNNPAPGITFACILSTLAQLGARRPTLGNMGWCVNANTVFISPEKRNSVLYRMVVLVTASARSCRVSKENVPDVLMAMIFIANEPSTPHDLQYDIILAINELCRSLAPGADISTNEPVICTKVLQYLSTLEPVNKAFIAALFGSGTGRTRRIASWISYGIITDQQTQISKIYSDLPPLLPIVEELTRKCQDGPNTSFGKFELHEKTDFADMMSYVEILSTAVTNIEGYLDADRLRSSSAQATTLSRETPSRLLLKALRLAIDKLHSEISDIRATHLVRSRTKAALKELSLRLHYQHKAALQKFDTLHFYLRKKSGTRPLNICPSEYV